MNQKLEQTIKDEMVRLPKYVAEAVSTVNWVAKAEEIGTKNKLSEEEIDDLQTEVLLVLIASEDMDSFGRNIENNVGLSKEEAETIKKAVSKEIFSPISKKLSEIIFEKLPKMNPSFEQNVSFLLSNGDYTVFLEKRDDIIFKEDSNIKKDFTQPKDLRQGFIV